MFNFAFRLASLIIYRLAWLMGTLIGKGIAFLWAKTSEKLEESRAQSHHAKAQAFTAEQPTQTPPPLSPRILIPEPDGKAYMTDGHDIRLKLTAEEVKRLQKGEDPFVGEWK